MISGDSGVGVHKINIVPNVVFCCVLFVIKRVDN